MHTDELLMKIALYEGQPEEVGHDTSATKIYYF